MSPRFRPLVALLALVSLLALGACGSGDGAAAQGNGRLEVVGATVDRPLNPSLASVRFTIENGTGAQDHLVAASSPVAERVTVHRSVTSDEGLATMEPEPRLAVPARSEVVFAPGGLHVMLDGLTRELALGDRVEVTLTFERAGSRTVTAEVVEPGSGTEMEHDHAE